MAGLPESERDVGERLRRHLQFFFMDPMMKWRLILFAELRMSHIDFMDDTNTYYMIQEDSFASFSYDTSLVHREKRNEILHGEEATATKKIHFNQIPPLELCINRIASVIVFNNTYEFDISEVN
uniref:Uncharacterized protein n=1 Tax=Parascaris equorum TaxID=6256 RepID=A0A914SD34_PAREQ